MTEFAWDDAAARALSEKFERVTWPPRVGARVHYNSGWPRTSWTGEVRGIVDDQVVVYLSSSPAYAGRSSYKLETRLGVEMQSKDGTLRYGPIPRLLCKER